MIKVISIIISAVGLLGVLYYTRFAIKEQKDERGEKITGSAAEVSFVVFLLGYLIIFFIGTLCSLTSKQYMLANACLFSGVVCSYSVSILYLRRKY